MIEQKGHSLVNLLALYHVIVVKYDAKEATLLAVLRNGGQLVDQGDQNSLSRWGLGGSKCTQQALPNLRYNRLSGRDSV